MTENSLGVAKRIDHYRLLADGFFSEDHQDECLVSLVITRSRAVWQCRTHRLRVVGTILFLKSSARRSLGKFRDKNRLSITTIKTTKNKRPAMFGYVTSFLELMSLRVTSPFSISLSPMTTQKGTPFSSQN